MYLLAEPTKNTEISNCVRDQLAKSLRTQTQAYWDDKIILLNEQIEEFGILKLQNKDSYIKLDKHYTRWEIVNANFEPATYMK